MALKWMWKRRRNLQAGSEGLAGIICNFLCSLEIKGAAFLDVWKADNYSMSL